MPKNYKKPEVEPRVGIFWFYDGKLITDSTALSKAEPYGDALTHPTGHIDFWSGLQQRGLIPAFVEYEEPPRGRVGYDKRREQFFLYADRCIIENAAAIKGIITAFHLPNDIKPELDSHYRCSKCLRGRH